MGYAVGSDDDFIDAPKVLIACCLARTLGRRRWLGIV
jgi:hypothetical protein